MNRIFVLKDVAYAAKTGGGVIASSKEVGLLVPGALAFFTHRGELLTLANAASLVPDVKEVMVASGRTADTQLIPQVPRKVNDINRGNYRAFVKPVITIGVLSIAAADVGDVSIRVSDISYTSRYSPRFSAGSTYKKANHTIEEAVDAVIAALNKAGSFITAAKVDTEDIAEVSTIVVTAACTSAGTATVDLNGVSRNLALTDDTIAVNAGEIASAIDALTGWSAVSDGVDTVTITADAGGIEVDIASYTAGTATSSAATVATVTQGVDTTNTLFSITVTPNDEDIAIEVALTGLIEGDNIETTTASIYGIGRGVDALQMEKDFSVEEGNGNYIDYTAEWYSRVFEALEASNYDMITTLWDGLHSTPSAVKSVMHNRFVIACINGAGNGQSATDILAIMALIFANVFVPATAGEPSTDTGTEHDGIAGN